MLYRQIITAMLLWVSFSVGSIELSAQENRAYRPDSILYFELPGVDTLGARAIKKITYEYDRQFRPLVCNEFRWDRLSEKWINSNRMRYQYIQNEVIISRFSIDMNFTERPVDKLYYVYNQFPLRIREIRRETSDSASKRITLRERTRYEYDAKDSLLSAETFVASTTFYRKSSMKYQRSNKLWTTEYKEFRETDNNELFTERIEYTRTIGGYRLKKLIHSIDTLKNRTTVVIFDKNGQRLCDSSYSLTPKGSKPLKQYYSIQWYQYNGEHLKGILFLETEAKGSPKRSTKNQWIKYFCRSDSPILVHQPGDVMLP